MKKAIITVFVIFALLPIYAQSLGKIRFVMGDVQYRINQNSPWKAAELNGSIDQTGMIKTGLDSTIEILWSSNLSSTIGAGKTVSLRSLYDEVHKKQKWVTQLKDKAEVLSLQTKQRASTVAGIRRDEVEIKNQSELFWDMEPLQNLEDAIASYTEKNYSMAIQKLNKVIEQGPLKRDAEIAHSYLILIYEEQKNTLAMKKQIDHLRDDFPRSAILDSLPKDL